MSDVFGGFAAVLASLGFSITSTLFTLAGRKFTPIMVMRFSVPVAMVFIVLLHWLTTGAPLPLDAGIDRWIYLGLSGATGFWLASVLIVNAFARIGPRLSLLVAAVNPIISTILAWVFLDQQLAATTLIGIALTMAGIAYVVTDGQRDDRLAPPDSLRAGILFALGGSSLQAVGFVLSTKGLEGDFDPLSGSLMRVLAGSVVLWLMAMLRGEAQSTLRAFRTEPVAVRYLSAAAIAGPVAGASLALVALQRAPVGVASTLLNLNPLFLIPISYLVFQERITQRAVVGTVIAVIGTSILFL